MMSHRSSNSTQHSLPLATTAFPALNEQGIPLKGIKRTHHRAQSSALSITQLGQEREILVISNSRSHGIALPQRVGDITGVVISSPPKPQKRPIRRLRRAVDLCSVDYLYRNVRGTRLANPAYYRREILLPARKIGSPESILVSEQVYQKLVLRSQHLACKRRLREHARLTRFHDYSSWYTLANSEGTDYAFSDEEEVEAEIAVKSQERTLRPVHDGAAQGTYVPLVTPPRDPELLKKLREKCRAIYRSRSVRALTLRECIWYLNAKLKCYPTPQGNDEFELDGSTTVQEDKAGNVCLQRQREESKTCTERVAPAQNIGAGDENHQFQTLLDRWLLFDKFSWHGDAASDTTLKKYVLPAYVLENKRSSPNMQPFKIFQYWQGDLEVKIQINANKFQVGQLQCSWLYDTMADVNSKHRENIYSLSQTNHVLINAADSTPASLRINYHNPQTHLPITAERMDGACLNLGTLYIKVLNELVSSSTTHNACYVSVFIRFPNSSFIGMRPDDVGKFINPQMMPMMGVLAAERVLNNYLPDQNRDKPTYSGARLSIAPGAISNMAVGTNMVESLNTLRLDARGQTPHMMHTDSEQEVSTIAQRMGLLTTIQWTSDNHYGDSLLRVDGTPQPQTALLKSTTIQSNTCYYMPPVAVMSSLYSYWRGNLAVRLDIVASQYHTGRLLLCYMTRTLENITLEQALGCPHATVDLQENQSYTLELPYITNRYWWPRRYGFVNRSDSVDPPGRLHIFVLNPLIPMDSVSNKIFVNVYWGGTTCFEVGVPAQPAIGTCFFTTDDTPTNEVKAQPGYYPWYWGYYGDFYNGKKAIARYGKGYEHVAQFFNLKANGYYTVNAKFKVPAMYKNDSTLFNPQYFGAIDISDGYGYVYMGVFENEYYAKKYAASAIKDRSLFMDVAPNDDGPWSNGNPVFDFHEVAPSINDDFIIVQPQMDTCPDERERTDGMCSMLPCPAPTVCQKTFGESHANLKDLCRRYQPYGFISGTTTVISGDVSFSFPVLPQGLDLDIEKFEKVGIYYQKYARDGVIPLILSGYKFFKGSIRYHLVMAPGKDVMVWVQHRPDKNPDKLSMQAADAGTDGDSLLNTGYAMTIQCTAVNNVLSFEVPFFVPYDSIFLQRPNLKLQYVNRMNSLGQITVGVEAEGNAKISYKAYLFYSLGDDSSFSTFQGFPPMIALTDLPPPKIHTKENLIEPQGLFDYFTPKVNHEITVSKETTSQVKELFKSTGIDEALSKLTSTLGNASSAVAEVITEIISQLGHIIMNPTVKSLAWAIASLIIKLGLATIEKLKLISGKLSCLIEYLGFNARKPVDNAVIIEPQSDDDSPIPSYISMLFLLIGQVSSAVIHPPRNITNFIKILTSDLGTNLRTSNFAFVFVRNNITLFTKIMNYCTLKLNPQALLEHIVEREDAVLVEWADEVAILLDVENDEKTFARDAMWADRIEYAYILGTKLNKLFLSMTADSLSRSLYGPFQTLFSKLCKKRDLMFQRGYSIISRREPFCVWMAGEPGVGKSQLAQVMMPRMLNYGGIKYEGQAVFTLPSGAKWWNGCRNQPCIYLDDFLNVRGGECGNNAIADYWMIKSPAILNPPQAHVDQKEARYAPEVCWVNCNATFPKLPNIDETAFFRRRDCLVKCELIPLIVNAGYITMTSKTEELKLFLKENNINRALFDHLQFYIAEEPHTSQTKWGEPLNFTLFQQKLYANFTKYYNDQVDIYKSRKEEFESLYTTIADTGSLSALRERYNRLGDFLKNAIPKMTSTPAQYFKLCEQYIDKRPIDKDMLNELCTLAHDMFPEEVEPQMLPQFFKSRSLYNNLPLHLTDYTDIYDNFTNADDEPSFAYNEFIREMPKLDYPDNEKKQIVHHLISVMTYNTHILSALSNLDTKEQTIIIERELMNDEKINLAAMLSFLRQFPLLKNKKWHNIFSETHKRLDTLTYIAITLYYSCVYRFNFKAAGAEATRGLKALYEPRIFTGFFISPLIGRSISQIFRFLASISTSQPCCSHWRLTPFHDFNYEENTYTHPVESQPIQSTMCQEQCLWQHHFFQILSIMSWTVLQPYYSSMVHLPSQLSLRGDLIPLVSDMQWRAGVKPDLGESPLRKIVNKFKSVLTFIKENIHAAGAALYRWAAPKLRILVNVLKYIAPIMAILGMFLLIKRGNKDDEINPQLVSSGDTKTMSSLRSGIKVDLRTFGNISPQMGLPNQQINQVLDALSKNFIYLSAIDANDKLVWQNLCLGLYENVVLVLNHYLETFERKGVTEVMFHTAHFSYRRKLSDLHVTKSNSDLTLVTIPNASYVRDIRKYIAYASDHERPLGSHYFARISGNQFYFQPMEVTLRNGIKSRVNEAAVPYDIHHGVCYQYKWEGKGLCGSILLNPALNRPIVGIHVAGGCGVGYAETLSFEEFATKTSTLNLETDPIGIIPVADMVTPFKGNFIPIGIADTGLHHSQSSDTSIIPSLVHNKFFQNTTEPAPLGNRDPRLPEGTSPLWAGVENMMKPTYEFPTKDVALVTDTVRQILLSQCKPVREVVGTLSYQTAVCGEPGDLFKGIDMHTSEGFPFSRYRPAGESSKSWLFQIEHTNDPQYPTKLLAIHEDLLNVIKFKNNLRAQGIIPNTIFDDNLKDARLPISKCTIPGKTRIFSTSPVDYTILCKQLCGEFLAAFKKNKIQLPHAIGIAADSCEWAQLVNRLNEIDGVFITGDYKNFGPSLNSSILRRIAGVIDDWYNHYSTELPIIKSATSTMRRVLAEESINCVHMTQKYIWKAISGLPSGCPWTVEWNSLTNFFYILLAWLDIFRHDTNLVAIHRFFEHVRLITYGDDLIMKVSHHVKDAFNNLTLGKFFLKYNIIFTDASKSGNRPWEDSLSECTFLKRSFLPHPYWPREYLAPLDINTSVLEVMNWVIKTPDMVAATEVAIEAANNNAYGLGPTKFKEFHEIFKLALISINSTKILRQWDEFDNIFFKMYYN